MPSLNVHISVMTFVFEAAIANGRLSDAALLDFLEAAGFDGAEVMASALLKRPACREAYEKALANSPLRISCIDGACNFIGADGQGLQQGIADLRAAIQLAHALKAPLVLAFGSQLSPDVTPEKGRALIAEGLATCMPEAQAAGITLAIECFGVAPTLQCAASHCLEILNAVPQLSFVFDTANFYFAGEDALANFDALAGKTCHVHLKDWVRSATPEIGDVAGAPLGEGLIPNEALVARFLAQTPVRSFSLESAVGGGPLEAVRRDLHTLRRWLS